MATNYSRGDRPVPDFELLEPLGRGGFGVVWRASGPGGIEAALKVINLTAKQGLKEFRGLQRVKNIRHPNLVFLYGFWLKDEYGGLLDGKAVDDQDSALLAETLRGTLRSPVESSRPAELIIAMGLGDKTLADRLQECTGQGLSGIPVEELLPYMEDAARGIDHLNARSVQHCDVKPSNIMIVGGAVQVCDFGLARLMGDVKATSPAMSVAYSAPEVLEHNRPSLTTDQYSLAITYYELRTAVLPFPEASPLQVMHFHMRGELDYARLAPAEQEIIRKATSLDPSQRYASSVEMVRALHGACQAQGAPIGSAQAFYAPPIAATGVRRAGQIVPGYRLVRELARSGDDQVWLAEGVEGNVALLVRDLDASLTIDLATLDAIKAIEHNHLTELRAYWLLDATGNVVVARPDDTDTPAEAAQLVVLGRLARKTLHEVLEEHLAESGSALAAAAALRYLNQVADAVDYLNAPIHQVSGRRVSIQHRAVRPENVMCFGDSVKLGNFLSARLLEGPLTFTTAAPKSNLAYAPPEAHAKVVTRWSDQYSLAVMYYQLRTGALSLPRGQHADEVGAVELPEPLNLALLPEEERAVIARATSTNPEERFQSCLELVEALESVLPREQQALEIEAAEHRASAAPRESEIDLSFLGAGPSGATDAPAVELGPVASSRVAEAPPVTETPDDAFGGRTLDLSTPVRDTRGSSPLQETVSERPVAAPPPELPKQDTDSGLLDGRYQLSEQVGEGAFAVVYRAKDSRLNKDVAVKVLKIEHTTDPARLVQLRSLFQREARMSARLEDPNIVHVSDAHVTPSGIPYLVTEFLEGRLFQEVIASESPLQLPRIEALLEQLCSAVDTAHEENIVHRDLKPGNLMLVYSRSGERLKVLDFGLAKLMDQAHMSLTQGAPIGTPHYMSPEQHRGEDATALSDIYAIGVILFEMLTGRLPFDTPGRAGMDLVHELRRLHCEVEPPEVTRDRPDVPSELNSVICKALAKDARARFASATELLQAFREAVAPKQEQPEPRHDAGVLRPPDATSPWLRPARLLVGGVAAVVVLIVVAHLLGIWEEEEPRPSGDTEPPVAVIEPPVFDRGDFRTVHLDASNSSSPNGEINGIEWDFGDGARDSGATVSHQYGRHGKYIVKVQVTDNAGRQAAAQREVSIRLPIHHQLQAAWDRLSTNSAAAREEFTKLLEQVEDADDEGLRAWAKVGLAVAYLGEQQTDDARGELDGVQEGDISELAERNVPIARSALAALFDDDNVVFLEQMLDLRGPNWANVPAIVQQHLAQRAELLRDEVIAAEATGLKLLEDAEHYNLDLQTLLAAVLLDRQDRQAARTHVEQAAPFVASTSTAHREYLDLLWARTVVEDPGTQEPQMFEQAANRLARWLENRPKEDALIPLKLKVLLQLGRREGTASRRREVLNRVLSFAQDDSELAQSLGEPLVELACLEIESRVPHTDSPGEFREALRLAETAQATTHAKGLARTFLVEALLEQNGENRIATGEVQRAAELFETMEPQSDWATYAAYVEALVIFRGEGANQPQLFRRPLEESLQAREKWSTALRDRRTRTMCRTLAEALLPEQSEDALAWLVRALEFPGDHNENQQLRALLVREARVQDPELAEKHAAVMVEHDPANRLANELLAIAESKRGSYSKALDHCEWLLADDVAAAPEDATKELELLQTALDWAREAEAAGANEQKRIARFFDRRGQIIQFWRRAVEGLENPWYEEARRAFENAVAFDDATIDYRLRLGNLLALPEFRPWDLPKIEEMANSILTLDDQHPGGLALRGSVDLLKAHGLLPHAEIRSLAFRAKEHYDRAIEILRTKRDQSLAGYLVNRSAILTFLGQHLDHSPEAKGYYLGAQTLPAAMAEYARRAKEDAEEAARQFPIKPPYWVLEAWGNALEDEADYGTNKMDLFQQAIDKFEQCKEAIPPDPDYQVNVGRAYYKWSLKTEAEERKAKWTQAAKALSAVIDQDRGNPEACYFLGNIALAQDRPGEAERLFVEAVTHGDPKAPYWYPCLRSVLVTYAPATRDQILADASKLRNDPTRAHAGFYLEGACHQIAGDYARAEQLFQQGLAGFPDDFLLNLGGSQSLNRLGKFQVALEHATRAEQLARTAAEKVQALDARAEANEKLKRFDQAIEDYKTAFELVADRDEAANFAAMVAYLYHFSLKQKDLALQWVDQGLRQAPRPETRSQLAELRRLITQGR